MHTGDALSKTSLLLVKLTGFLLYGKKEKFSCPVFLLQSNILLKKMATNVHGSQCPRNPTSRSRIVFF
jgi:hypothetical protein